MPLCKTWRWNCVLCEYTVIRVCAFGRRRPFRRLPFHRAAQTVAITSTRTSVRSAHVGLPVCCSSDLSLSHCRRDSLRRVRYVNELRCDDGGGVCGGDSDSPKRVALLRQWHTHSQAVVHSTHRHCMRRSLRTSAFLSYSPQRYRHTFGLADTSGSLRQV